MFNGELDEITVIFAASEFHEIFSRNRYPLQTEFLRLADKSDSG